MDSQDYIALERMIDNNALPNVLLSLESICREKAEHIRASYDPRDPAARWWDRAALKLVRCADRITSQ